MQPETETLCVVNEFLQRCVSDRAAGSHLPLEHYQGLFPGYDEVIAAEYRALDERVDDRAAADLPPILERVGPYRLIRELGHGGQGVVYLAEDTHLQRPVALKLLSSHLSFSSRTMARFVREAQVASRLQHPGICTVFDAGEVDGVAFLAMQYVEGESLADKIGRARRENRRQVVCCSEDAPRPEGAETSATSNSPILQIVRLVESAARAVHAVHEAGVVHRDLKPGNLMVTPQGEPVILDFGLARAREEQGETLTHTGDVLGTPAYLAPERLDARPGRGDTRTDVYGLGAILFECLTLHQPFEAPTREGLYRKILGEPPPNPTRSNPEIPRDLAVVIATALEKEPARRYQTALDLAEDLRRVRSHEPIRARPAGALLRLGRWTQRNPVVAGLLVLLTLALVAITLSLAETRSSLDHAHALGLVGASEAAMQSDQLLALQLAWEAVGIRQIEETVSQLHAANAGLHERAVLRHNNIVFDVATSPDGERILSSSFDGEAMLWTSAGRLLAGPLRPETPGLTGATVFSPDGDRFLTAHGGEEYGAVALWAIDADGGVRQFAELLSRGRPLFDAAFSADGQRVAVANAHGGPRLWRLDGEEASLTCDFTGEGGHPGPVGNVCFSPDGELVLTTGGWLRWMPSGIDNSPRLWSVEGDLLATLDYHRDIVISAGFSARGDRIVTASEDGDACLWDLTDDGVHRGPVLRGHEDAVYEAVFSPSGKRIVTASADKTARVWTDAGDLSAVLRGHAHEVRRARFSADGERVLTCSNDNTVRVWDLQGRELARLLGHRSRVLKALFVPNRPPHDPWILSGSYDTTARIWSLQDQELPVFLGHTGQIVAADFLHPADEEDPWAMTASADGTVRFWLRSGAEREDLRLLLDNPVTHALVARRGARLLTVDRRRTRLWEWRNRRYHEIAHRDYRSYQDAVAFSPAGDLVLIHPFWPTGSSILWNDEGREVPLPHQQARDAEFAPDGKSVLSGLIWPQLPALVTDLEGNTLLELRGHTSQLTSVAFSADGGSILTGSVLGKVRLYARSGELLATCEGHDGEVKSLRFSPDPAGRYFLSAGNDGTARLWNRRGDLLTVYRGHTGPVESAVFSPDGRHVLTASADGTARTWLVEPADLLDHVRERLGGRRIADDIRRRYPDLLR